MSSHRDSSQPTLSRRARMGWTVPLGSPASWPIRDPYQSAARSLKRTSRTNRVAMVIRGGIVVLYLGSAVRHKSPTLARSGARRRAGRPASQDLDRDRVVGPDSVSDPRTEPRHDRGGTLDVGHWPHARRKPP